MDSVKADVLLALMAELYQRERDAKAEAMLYRKWWEAATSLDNKDGGEEAK